jgi:glutamate N-acetyltransferase/amino-acid N-acetyltransferase
MAVNLVIPDRCAIYPVDGVEIGIASAGIRKPGKKDLTVFRLAPGTTVAGVFTNNRFKAAPVKRSEINLASNIPIQALVINTGNANAGTGQSGDEAAQRMCEATAQALGLTAQAVLPFSTGVILEPLPVEKIEKALPDAVADLSADHWYEAAHSIMTTDTQPKIHSSQLALEGHTVTMTGISKGAGMIRPNMATMLGYLATDAGLSQPLLQRLVTDLANHSFNRITVDGDTSTNDSFILMATGRSGAVIESEDDRRFMPLRAALMAAATDLACKIVRDAEGATKFMTIRVENAGTQAEALKVAYAIAHSPLVKTAFFASDPNLGRILAAIGYAGIEDLDVDHVKLWLGDVLVAQDGGRHPDYQEAQGQAVMSEAEILVRVSLGRGEVSETVYTCDFSHEYVTINADYRS